jgi:hypothetical protein
LGGKFVKILILQKLGGKKNHGDWPMVTISHYLMDNNNNKRQNDYLMDYWIDEIHEAASIGW